MLMKAKKIPEKLENACFFKNSKKIRGYVPGEATTKIWKKSMQWVPRFIDAADGRTDKFRVHELCWHNQAQLTKDLKNLLPIFFCADKSAEHFTFKALSKCVEWHHFDNLRHCFNNWLVSALSAVGPRIWLPISVSSGNPHIYFPPF